jgi:hypothetical protein
MPFGGVHVDLPFWSVVTGVVVGIHKPVVENVFPQIARGNAHVA